MAYTTIDDPTKYFDTTIWTGNGGAKTIRGLNHKPDWIWSHPRNVAYNHMISDSSRGFGADSELVSNSTGAEGSGSAESYGYKSGHTADGWTMVNGNTDDADNQEDGNTNEPGKTYVGWTWAANGGTTTTNDASSTGVGNQDSVYQANTTAGFSIVTWTGSNANATLAHGLGAVPNWIIVKARGGTEKWGVYHHKNTSAPETDQLILNATDATADTTTLMNDTAPTSTVFTVADSGIANEVGKTYVGYLFAEKQGYSKFGAYTGNGNQNGTFVYTGFKPAWIMIKRTDAAKNWYIADSTRSPSNITKAFLVPNLSAAEDTSGDGTDAYFDILSNGFKLRQDFSHLNADDGSHIYMAFAESPFVTSNGAANNGA